jgi:1,4-alpha-glucan branching enzyme
LHDLKPWSNGGRPYDHAHALELAREHAHDFVRRVTERLDAYAAERGRPGLLCCALDTELLGHWWYEGPAWLAEVLSTADAEGLDLATLPAALEGVEPVERELAASTWGSPKDLSTWDSARVAEIAFTARGAELATVAAAASGRPGLALERAARELFALQSSDWAFLMTRDLAADYPLERVRAHVAELTAALGSLDSAPLPDPELRSLAPELDLAALVSP